MAWRRFMAWSHVLLWFSSNLSPATVRRMPIPTPQPYTHVRLIEVPRLVSN